MASLLSRSLCRSLLSNPGAPYRFSVPFCANFSSSENSSSSDDSSPESDLPESDPFHSSQTSAGPTQQRFYTDPLLENGLDVGTYKAILVGQVGQTPIQKKLKSGRIVTLLSVGTGGIRNNRRPLDNEEPRDYANRCSVQWHRVSIYPEKLGEVAMKHVTPGLAIFVCLAVQ